MTPPAAPAASQQPRVVLVDDDATIRRFVALVLEDQPLELVCCANAAEARAALRDGPAALLITDLMMPGESGFELLASLVADPALRGPARLAVFSAGLNAQTRARLAGLDVWRELDKPVSVAALEACVAEVLALAGVVAADPGAAVADADLSASEQVAVAEQFGGDIALFKAFRAHALPQFVHDREVLVRALDEADWPAVHRQAHSLKGALATLGDAAGAARARALEDAAARPEPAACREAWPVLSDHLLAMASKSR
jgi:CheY-like chemotaxis protein